MKDAVVTLLKSSPNIKVSEMILGHSIETGANVIGGMLSDRFANPKFLGREPADRTCSGLATARRAFLAIPL